MCIIAIKPANVDFPDKDTLRNMWENNSDGCGFMYAKKERVYIQKGYMEFGSFMKALNKKKDKSLPFVLHFRTATHGGINKENTHPFPITDNPKKLGQLYHETDIGVAHNGIISIKVDKGLSDTAQFVKDILSDELVRNNLRNPTIQALLYEYITSKMVFLWGNGEWDIIGGGWTTNDEIIYSNDDYKKIKVHGWYPVSDWVKYSRKEDKSSNDIRNKLEDLNCPICESPLDEIDCVGDIYYECMGCNQWWTEDEFKRIKKEGAVTEICSYCGLPVPTHSMSCPHSYGMGADW